MVSQKLKDGMRLTRSYIYDNTVGKLDHIYRKVKRVLAFIKIAYNNYDWDDFYLFELELFKLKRMLHEFENHSHHCPSCENYIPKMKSIKLAIKLGERYVKQDYYRFHDLHEKKYGVIDLGFEPIEGSNNSLMINLKDGVKYERSDQERLDFREAFNKDDRQKDRDRELFYKIIIKYGRYWWD